MHFSLQILKKTCSRVINAQTFCVHQAREHKEFDSNYTDKQLTYFCPKGHAVDFIRRRLVNKFEIPDFEFNIATGITPEKLKKQNPRDIECYQQIYARVLIGIHIEYLIFIYKYI